MKWYENDVIVFFICCASAASVIAICIAVFNIVKVLYPNGITQ